MAGVVHERVVSLLNVCYVLIMFYCVLFFGLLNLFCCCPTWAGSYPVVDGACHLAFPQDHQSHDAYRTEWWYVTGNLRDKTGHRYGVQLTLFRRRLHPASDDVVSASAWRTPQLYLVHAAITDVDAKTHSHAEDMVRAGPGLAGSVRQGNDVRIVMKKNFIQFMASGLQVHAETGNIRFTLDLETQKPLILHGEDGYSQKGPAKIVQAVILHTRDLMHMGVLRVMEKTSRFRDRPGWIMSSLRNFLIQALPGGIGSVCN